MQGKALLVSESLRQPLRQVAIKFDSVNAGATFNQWPCNGSLARTDLNNVLASLWRDRQQDALYDILVMQKILSEPLACAVLRQRHGGRGHRLAAAGLACEMAFTISQAVAIAVNRLPVFALSVPARSRAVPWSTEVRMIGSPRVMLLA